MIVSNHQKDITYFKEYPCYSITTHLSQHRELQFANVTYVEFAKQTTPKIDLPKFYIDKYQTPQQMYWLEWRLQELSETVIEEGRNRIAHVQEQNGAKSPKSFSVSRSQMNGNTYRCLYVAELGKMAHVKLVFNYDPEAVAICQDYIYTIGGNQLIITELWPEIPFSESIISPEQLPPKQQQTVHQLDSQSKILSLDFVYDSEEKAFCKIIYFHERKGIYSQEYRRGRAVENSILNRIFDFSLKFKKKQEEPMLYQTLVPNILGVVIHNLREFSLFDLAQMKSIPNTRLSLEGWQLNQHQPVLIKSYQNQAHNDYNDCLSISIGQGSNIEIFLYHISYSTKAMVSCKEQTKPASEFRNLPIQMFSSGEFIDFQTSILKHFTIVSLQQITYLSNYILSKRGILYLGYSKNSSADQFQNSEELPITGFILYETPYVTHQILMQENKIWKQYKLDILTGSDEQEDFSPCLERLLTPGRYEKSFILKTLKLNKITDLENMANSKNHSFKQINQKLLFEWRNSYKFVDFVIFREEVLIIRKNSIGTLIQITEEQFAQQKDQLSERQVSYDELLSRGFSVHYDLQGDEYIDQQFNQYRHKHESDDLHRNYKSHEDKMRIINAKVKSVMEEGLFETGLAEEDKMSLTGYYDEQQIEKYSKLYEKTVQKINHLAQSLILLQFSPNSKNSITRSPFQASQQQLLPIDNGHNQILLHTSILSLRVKDQLNYFVNTLKTNYHYYFEKLLQTAKKQNQRLRKQRKQQITPELLQKIHLQHVYLVFVLEWIVNIATKSHLQQQYEIFGHDLVEEFVEEYAAKIQQQNLKISENPQRINQNQILKAHLDLHVNNIFSIMFRGLLKDVNLQKENNILIATLQVSKLAEQEVINMQVDRINKQTNPFILMLLKKHYQIQGRSRFIAWNLLKNLYGSLLGNTFNQNLSLFIPINKTFVYAILSLWWHPQQKTRILASHMDKKSFLALLLLIQLQNNCYLSIIEGVEVEIYGNDLQQFEENTVRLDQKSCCILQELILTNYKLFLFPSSSSVRSQIQELHIAKSQNSDVELQTDRTIFYQQLSIQFIKSLFSSIDFMNLTSGILGGYLFHLIRNAEPELSSSNENKSLAYIYQQLIQQVEEINENYGQSKGSRIQRTFRRFYTKIYHHKSKFSALQNSLKPSEEAFKNGSEIYPEITGLGYKLSKWELDVIGRLYERQKKIIKLEKKHTFESTTLIQRRLNLQYAMLKVHIFRVHTVLKQLPTLTESDKQQYVQIMRECIQRLKEAVRSFKHWSEKLGQDEDGAMTDKEFLHTLAQIDRMENSRVWTDKSSDLQDYQYVEDNSDIENWSILGYPITLDWLNLLQLTFSEATIYNRSLGRPINKQIFTNYQSQESMLMKMLIVVKQDRLQQEYESLIKLFGEEKIQSVIQGNEQLRRLYDGGFQAKENLFNGYLLNGSDGLLSRGSMQPYFASSQFERNTQY